MLASSEHRLVNSNFKLFEISLGSLSSTVTTPHGCLGADQPKCGTERWPGGGTQHAQVAQVFTEEIPLAVSCTAACGTSLRARKVLMKDKISNFGIADKTLSLVPET